MSSLRGIGRLAFPVVGTLRLHPDPEWIPATTNESRPPRHRFDDPVGGPRGFSVRYTALTLRGCLLECLAQFRFNDEARADAVLDFLAVVRLGRCSIADGGSPPCSGR